MGCFQNKKEIWKFQFQLGQTYKSYSCLSLFKMDYKCEYVGYNLSESNRSPRVQITCRIFPPRINAGRCRGVIEDERICECRELNETEM